ncbi:MAG: hypothetical protein FWH22_06215 [Fibromonadales bacterium]|nr:hypothetical protein [Fibromonadales bacterium]
MKKFLLFAVFSFYSCATEGNIEFVPGATKMEFRNESAIHLQNVRWNGRNFGNIEPGGISEMIVSEGHGYIFFNASNGESYQTAQIFIGEKHRSNRETLTNQMLVANINNPDERKPLGGILNAD